MLFPLTVVFRSRRVKPIKEESDKARCGTRKISEKLVKKLKAKAFRDKPSLVVKKISIMMS